MADDGAQTEHENEILAEAKRITAQRKAGEAAQADAKRDWPIGPIAAAGIGSAALAAAVLWSRRERKK